MKDAKYKLYFALQPPPEVAEETARLLARVRPGAKARAQPAARLHVSLNWVGGFGRPPTGIVDKAREVGAAVKARPFDIAFNRIGTWEAGKPPWPLVLWGDEGVIGVDGLYTAIHRALVRPGMAPRRQPEFTPHMTLLRDAASAPETPIDPVRWTVREFVLLLTVVGEGRQDVLGRFPLSG